VKRIRRTEITVETDEIMIISNRASVAEVCPVCGRVSGIVALDQADTRSFPTATIRSRPQEWKEGGVRSIPGGAAEER
jgi:hypothetical protein